MSAIDWGDGWMVFPLWDHGGHEPDEHHQTQETQNDPKNPKQFVLRVCVLSLAEYKLWIEFAPLSQV